MSERSAREQGMNKYKYFFYKLIILPSLFFVAYFVLLSTTTMNFWLYLGVLSTVGLITVIVSENLEVRYKGEFHMNNERVTRSILNVFFRSLAMSMSLTVYLVFVLDPTSPPIRYEAAYICISKTYMSMSIGFYILSTVLINLLTLKIFRRII